MDSSEAVYRCFTSGSTAGGAVASLNPRPPFAIDRPRPQTAPMKKSLAGTKPAWHGPNADVVPHKQRKFIVSMGQTSGYTRSNVHAPYAARLKEVFTNEGESRSVGYPRVENGKTVLLPEYSALTDPHLVDYYARKFNLATIPRPPSMSRRPVSAPNKRNTGAKGQKKTTDVVYKVVVTTGNKKSAGTDAHVYVQLKGRKGKMPKKKLTKKSSKTQSGFARVKFSRNTTKTFRLKSAELGELESLTIEHDGLEKRHSWFLDSVEVTNLSSKQKWSFHCNQWLSLFEGDCQLSRTLEANSRKKYTKTEYEVVVVTGDKKGAGTDANVSVTLFGSQGITKKMRLQPPSGSDPFERGSSDIFNFKCNNVGVLKKIRIEHDNTGFAPGWFLERVVVTDQKNPKKGKFYFPCHQWFSKDEADGAISRDLLGSRDPSATRRGYKYVLHVFTGKKRGAGTDANVSVTIFGEAGDSGNSKNNFERSREDQFTIESYPLGPLRKIRIGHDNSMVGAGWFLDKVIIDDIEMNATYEFPCNRWLAKDEDDGLTTRELYCGKNAGSEGIPYEVRVTTSDKRQAGTDARVYIVMYGGKKGEETSGRVPLTDGKFERGRTDACYVELDKVLSPLSRIEIGHDNSGPGAGWHLDKVVVDCPSAGIEQTFVCGQWLADDEGDGCIERTLHETKNMRKSKKQKQVWNASVTTSDLSQAGTDAKVSFCLYGSKGKSDDIPLQNQSDVFERGETDEFKVEAAEVGKPYKLRVWHDNSGRGPGWHLDKIVLENVTTKKQYIFNCGQWLARDEGDGEIIREMAAEGDDIKTSLPAVTYNVQVVTGDKFGAGTDANISCTLFGEKGDTGERPLRRSKNNRNKFERKSVDEFTIEAVSLQKLSKLRIGHDNAGAGSGWFLDKVIVSEAGVDDSEVVFPCNRWLDRDEDDGLTVRELLPEGSAQLLSTTSYHVSVKTGDERGAGTDANVHLKLFGKDGDTGMIPLKQAENTKNKFERGRTDQFTLEAVDIGQIEYLRIGHDGTGIGAGWFLDGVDINIPSRGESCKFSCHRWLAEDEDDGETEVELYPTETQKTTPRIPYEVTITTGDVMGAGTDANVFIRLYGGDGKKTEEFQLRNKTDNFERAAMEKFKIEAEDVGPLSKIRVGHDGTGRFAGWFLDRILVERFPPVKPKKKKKKQQERRRSKSGGSGLEDEGESLLERGKSPSEQGETTQCLFVCNRWLARSEDDSQIVRELVPTDESGKVLQKNSLILNNYTVHVFTGDIFQSGTDANVFVNVYGENGDSGERQLKASETNMNKFERNQEDIFQLEAADLGVLKKIKVRHDNTGIGSNWFLDRIEIEDKKREERLFFPCQRWLATDKEDGQLCRDLVPVEQNVIKRSLERSKSSTSIREEIALETKAIMETYHIFVTTSDVRGAGTDANVYINLYGENDDTGQHFLKSSKTNKNKFEAGQTDEFVIEAVNIGELKKIRYHNKYVGAQHSSGSNNAIGHDNKGGFAGWMLDKVEIDAPSLGKRWCFPCGRWLDKKEDDGQIERELIPVESRTEEYEKHVPYEITVHTSDVSGAGTDADVFIVLYGREVFTSQKSLCLTKKERKEKFERNAVDKFVVELEDIGETIEKVRIGHDNAGFGAAWHLNKVEVRKLLEGSKGSRTYTFPCDRWLSRKEDDGEIVRELVPQQVTEEKVRKDGSMKTKEIKQDTLTARQYKVHVYTGDLFRAGTDANVFVTVFGENGDTGERQLRNSGTHTDKFERGHCDKFSLEAVDIGKPFKVKIRHDNSGLNASWFLDRVEVLDDDGEMYPFHCERWIGKSKDDGKLSRSLYVKGYEGDISSTSTMSTLHRSRSKESLMSAISEGPPSLIKKKSGLEMPVFEGPTIPYTIRLTTGKEADMGTTANAFINIMGAKKKVATGRMPLQLMNKTKFDPASVETFSLEAIDVEDVKKIEIGHDGVTPTEGWFVEELEVDIPTMGKHYTFPCKQWLSKDKEDGLIARVLAVDDAQSLEYKPKIPYEVTVFTGDVPNAGTDSKITMVVYGANGYTPALALDKQEDRFERGREDMIRLEIEDITPLKKIRISHDGRGSRPDWFLEKVTLRNTVSGELTVFKCSDWLSKTMGEKKLTKELPALVRGKAQLKDTSYTVTVKTSDQRGAGTDANVFLAMFGENGNSDDLRLKESQTHRDKFERGQSDVFSYSMLSLGALTKVRIWHDNAGLKAGWHLEYVEVTDETEGVKYMFPCSRWLARGEDDGQIMRELICIGLDNQKNDKAKITYEIAVTTTDKRDAGTTQNAWVILEGDNRTSKEFVMENTTKKKILRRGDTDIFKFTTRRVGKLKSILLGHAPRDDGSAPKGSGRDVDWHCHSIVITDTSDGSKYTFPCKAWIPLGSGKEDARRLVCDKLQEGRMSIAKSLAPVQYEVEVVTSNEKGAGTDANVCITIYGTNGDSGKQPLKQRFRDLFEKGQTDKFKLEVLDLGELQKIRLEHDNAGFNPGWLCDHVVIANLITGKSTTFQCNKWLDKKKGDGELFKEVYAVQD